MATAKQMRILKTTDYDLFVYDTKNRDVELKDRGKLLASMQKYGFLWSKPAMVRKRFDGRYDVTDGQHRIAIARKLGLPVYYVIDDSDMDVALLNSTSKLWEAKDYLKRFEEDDQRGYYAQVRRFTKYFDITVGQAAALLSGRASYGKVRHDFESGQYRIKNVDVAWQVGKLFLAVSNIAPVVHNGAFLTACYAAMQVPEFDERHFLKNASTKFRLWKSLRRADDYLALMETIHNFGRGKTRKVNLAFLAQAQLAEM